MTPEEFMRYLQLAQQFDPAPVLAQKTEPTPAATPPFNPQSPWGVIMSDKRKKQEAEEQSSMPPEKKDEPFSEQSMRTLAAMFPKPPEVKYPSMLGAHPSTSQVKLGTEFPEALKQALLLSQERNEIPTLAELLKGIG